jgi:hypothetical protein
MREWDVLALPPSLAEPEQTDQQRLQNQLVQRLILAQDLALVVRQPNDHRSTGHLLSKWFDDQVAKANKNQRK